MRLRGRGRRLGPETRPVLCCCFCGARVTDGNAGPRRQRQSRTEPAFSPVQRHGSTAQHASRPGTDRARSERHPGARGKLLTRSSQHRQPFTNFGIGAFGLRGWSIWLRGVATRPAFPRNVVIVCNYGSNHCYSRREISYRKSWQVFLLTRPGGPKSDLYSRLGKATHRSLSLCAPCHGAVVC